MRLVVELECFNAEDCQRSGDSINGVSLKPVYPQTFSETFVQLVYPYASKLLEQLELFFRVLSRFLKIRIHCSVAPV